jgi:hypothetical protein
VRQDWSRKKTRRSQGQDCSAAIRAQGLHYMLMLPVETVPEAAITARSALPILQATTPTNNRVTMLLLNTLVI